ncbi:MAG: hypothetical protein ACE5OP_06135, partial [Candidatus Glassbacteria bacterium]
IVERNDSLVVVWEDHRHGNPEILSTLSIDGGMHWYNPTRLTLTPGCSIHPSITVWEDQLVLAWQENSDGNWEIYYQEVPLSSLVSPKSMSIDIGR